MNEQLNVPTTGTDDTVHVAGVNEPNAAPPPPNVIVMGPPVSVVGVKPLPVAVTVTPLGPCVGESVSAGVVIVNDWGAVFVPEAMSWPTTE